MTLRCIVFDCDGVLIDSVPVKTHAFARLAEPYGPEAVQRFVAFHEAHGGVNRYEKFAWFFQTILKRPIREEESSAWGENFTRFCREELEHCPLIPGAQEVLRHWHTVLPLFVCSGAPTEEQRSILQLHGLADFFTGIYGAPPAKAELLGNILKNANIAAEDALMVGDATTDLDAARTCKTGFYGIGERFAKENVPWAHDLTQFTDYLQTLRQGA